MRELAPALAEASLLARVQTRSAPVSDASEVTLVVESKPESWSKPRTPQIRSMLPTHTPLTSPRRIVSRGTHHCFNETRTLAKVDRFGAGLSGRRRVCSR